MVMNCVIKRLNGKNLDFMRALNKLFGEVFEDKENYQSHPPSDSYLTSYLNDEKNIVIVATIDNQVIGGLVAYILTKFEKERSEVYLYDLAVSKSHQRKGVGTILVQSLQAEAGKEGAYVVFVQADEGDAAIEFYRSLSPSEDTPTRSFDLPT
jgi:aminoglycoside 3-N-acetyltransferase I